MTWSPMAMAGRCLVCSAYVPPFHAKCHEVCIFWDYGNEVFNQLSKHAHGQGQFSILVWDNAVL